MTEEQEEVAPVVPGSDAPETASIDAAPDAAPVDAAPVDAAPEIPAGPPFVLETWVLDAIEALVFTSTEPLTPSRAREVIAAEMELMDNVEGKGLPTVTDMKHAFRELLGRWSQLAMREIAPPPPPKATASELIPLLDEAASTMKLQAIDESETEGSPSAAVEPVVEAAAAAVVEVAPTPPVIEKPAVRGFRLIEIDGALTFRTSAMQARFVRRAQMAKPQRLSRASLETLAVIAYRQPVTKPQIEEVRGVDSSGALKMLLDKKLIRVLGKAEEIGRPLLYGTTKTFLEFFELQSLNDLPTLKELHELEHGIDPNAVEVKDDRPAVIMDLFNADQVSSVSAETERESNEAMEALEKALGEAKDVAKRASTLVFGMQVEDDENAKPAAVAAATVAVTGGEDVAPAPPDEEKKDEES